MITVKEDNELHCFLVPTDARPALPGLAVRPRWLGQLGTGVPSVAA